MKHHVLILLLESAIGAHLFTTLMVFMEEEVEYECKKCRGEKKEERKKVYIILECTVIDLF